MVEVVKLRRVKLGETALQDGKRVWHRGEGVDLVTWVNWLGRAMRHEMTLDGGYVHWHRDEGVSTGREHQDDKASGKVKGSALQNQDSEMNQELVLHAIAIAEHNG